MKNKIFLFASMLILMIGSVLATTYYVGDPSFELPSISVQGTYQKDSTHHTYFACLSSLDGNSNVVSMSSIDTCEISRSFNPIESEIGDHIYSTAISYVSREWSPIDGWQTVTEGIDDSQTYGFSVEYLIPEDDFNVVDWLSGLLQDINDFFCDNFGLFCPSGPDGQANPI